MRQTILFSFLCPLILYANAETTTCTEDGGTVVVTKTIASTKIVTKSPAVNIQKKKSTTTKLPTRTTSSETWCDETTTSLARRATGDGGYSLPQYRTRLADPYESLHSSLSSASLSAVQARQLHTDALKVRQAASPTITATVTDPNPFTFTKYNLQYTTNIVEVAIAKATGDVLAASSLEAQITARAALGRRARQKYTLPYTSLPATILAKIEAEAADQPQKRDGFIGKVVRQNEDGTLVARDGEIEKRGDFLGKVVKQNEDGTLYARSNEIGERDGFVGSVVKQDADGKLVVREEQLEKREGFVGKVVKQSDDGKLYSRSSRGRAHAEMKLQSAGFIGVKVKQDDNGVLVARDTDRGVQENESLVAIKKWWASQ